MDLLMIYIVLMTVHTVSKQNWLQIKELFRISYLKLRLFWYESRNGQFNGIFSRLNNKFSEVQGNSQKNSDFENDFTKDTSSQFQTKYQAISLCVKIMCREYSGDPMTLDAFIDTIDLLEDLIAHDNVDILRRFILTRLVGEARLAIAGQSSSIEDIKASLRKYIKPVNTKAIEARILSLQFSFNRSSKLSYTNVCKFAEEAERLAHLLHHSLIHEGCNFAVAKKLTIEQILKLCRKLARSDLVNSILAASSFTCYKDVLSKLLIETMNEIVGNETRIFKKQPSYKSNYIRNFDNVKNTSRSQLHSTSYKWGNNVNNQNSSIPFNNAFNNQSYVNRQESTESKVYNRTFYPKYNSSKVSPTAHTSNKDTMINHLNDCKSFNTVGYHGNFNTSKRFDSKNDTQSNASYASDRNLMNPYNNNFRISDNREKSISLSNNSFQNVPHSVKRNFNPFHGSNYYNPSQDNSIKAEIPLHRHQHSQVNPHQFNSPSRNYNNYCNPNMSGTTQGRNNIFKHAQFRQNSYSTRMSESNNVSANSTISKPNIALTHPVTHENSVNNSKDRDQRTNCDSSEANENMNLSQHLPFENYNNNNYEDVAPRNKVTIEDLGSEWH